MEEEAEWETRTIPQSNPVKYILGTPHTNNSPCLDRKRIMTGTVTTRVKGAAV
jgi:hypothetical protein